MTRIAHLTDVHLDGTSIAQRRFVRALDQAARSRCGHLVITGDLTASGSLDEMNAFADSLRQWPEWAVTLVPGNHDLGPLSWKEALRRTSLGRFYGTSAPGAVRDLGDVVIVAVDTQCSRRAPIFRALGRVDDAQLSLLDAIVRIERRCVVIAMHHGPQWHPLQPFDGLVNREAVQRLLARGEHVSILCGHDHRSLDVLGGQVHTAASVAECDDPLRLYEVIGSRLVPTYRGGRGSYLLGIG